MTDLTGTAAIVTGASSGIGEATAHRLAQDGVSVALAARRKERLDTLRDDIEADGGTAIVCPTDVTDRDQVQALADATLDAFGRLPADGQCGSGGIDATVGVVDLIGGAVDPDTVRLPVEPAIRPLGGHVAFVPGYHLDEGVPVLLAGRVLDQAVRVVPLRLQAVVERLDERVPA